MICAVDRSNFTAFFGVVPQPTSRQQPKKDQQIRMSWQNTKRLRIDMRCEVNDITDNLEALSGLQQQQKPAKEEC